MRGVRRRRKNVAAMEGGRNGGLNHPALIGDFAGGIKAVTVNHGSDEAVVGEDEVLPSFCFDDDGFARGADAGVDDRNENGSGGIVRRHGFEKARAFFDSKRRDTVSDVHDSGVGGDADHDGFADGHGIVGGAEVGHKDDGWARAGFGSGRIARPWRFRACGAHHHENEQR